MPFQELLIAWAPFLGTLGGSTLALIAIHLAARRLHGRLGFGFQLSLIVLTFVAVVASVAALPINVALRGQLLSLMGVVVSAAIALSSTTFIGNAMAGLMLRAVRNFRPGDFLRVGEHSGRVSARGLFRTELQTEDSDLTTLPNLYLVTNPVTVIRAAGTVVGAEVSLGYDVSRHAVEPPLLEAAAKAGLEDAFVQVVELGDFSILYRVAGLLRDVTGLISARSRLRACMLDALHEAGIEIVSPNFMNTRAFAPATRFVPDSLAPPTRLHDPAKAPVAPDQLVFDKAAQAGAVEALRDEVAETERRLAEVHAAAKEAKKEADRDHAGELAEEARLLAEERKRLAAEVAAREAAVGSGEVARPSSESSPAASAPPEPAPGPGSPPAAAQSPDESVFVDLAPDGEPPLA